MVNNSNEIKITLQQIKDAGLCISGWRRVLNANADLEMNTEFPLSSVIDSNGIDDTLWCLTCWPKHNKIWRKYAVWCVRRVEHLLTDERSINALDVAWRHIEGLATNKELAVASDAAWAAVRDAEGAAAWAAARAAAWAAAWAAARAPVRDAAWAAVRDAVRAAAWSAARDAVRAAVRAAARDAAWDAAWDAARDAQSKKLREILTAGKWVDDGEAGNGE